jgi:hypothetical protein
MPRRVKRHLLRKVRAACRRRGAKAGSISGPKRRSRSPYRSRSVTPPAVPVFQETNGGRPSGVRAPMGINYYHGSVISGLRYHETVRYIRYPPPKGWDRTRNAGNAGKGEVLQQVGDSRLRPTAEFAAGQCRRSRASRGGIPGHPDRHRLSHTLRGRNRAAATTHTKWILMMRAYLVITGAALGLVAVWAALVPFVA